VKPVYVWTLIGRLPGLNEVTATNRNNRYAGAKQKRQTEAALLAQLCPRPQLSGGYHWRFTWYEADRRRDPDNIASAVKFIFDALQAAGIIGNDNWQCVLSISHTFCVSDDGGYGVRIEAHTQ